MIYRTNLGETIEADGFIELVCKLNENSKFGKVDDLKQFMFNVADAAAQQTGALIRYDNPENFVADLLANGFLTQCDLPADDFEDDENM